MKDKIVVLIKSLKKVVLVNSLLTVNYQCTEAVAIELFKQYPVATKIKEKCQWGGTWLRKVFIAQKKLAK